MWVLTAPPAHPGSAPARPARVPTAGGPALPSPRSPPCSELSCVPGSPDPGGQCPPSHLAALMRSPGLGGPPHDGDADAEKRGQDRGFVWGGEQCVPSCMPGGILMTRPPLGLHLNVSLAPNLRARGSPRWPSLLVRLGQLDPEKVSSSLRKGPAEGPACYPGRWLGGPQCPPRS